jgi:Golgi nucleoside diphosphatase
MNYPTVPCYLTEQEVAALRAGDHANVDSGLGGSFSVRFEGHEGEQFVFNNVSPDFESFGEYRYTMDEVRQHVYQLVIDPRYAREVELLTGNTYAEVLAIQAEKNRRYWLTKKETSH